VGAYERLIDRFIEIPRWPTSRKTALAVVVALVAHVGLTALAIPQLARMGNVFHVEMITRHLVWWCIALALVLLIAVVTSARGREGGWTVYVLIGVYGIFLTRFLGMFGMVSTALVALSPIVVLFVGIFFGAIPGAVAALYTILLYGVMASLELAGVSPYADAVIDRAIDAHREPHLYLTIFGVVQAVFAYVFVMTTLIASARKRQQQQLETANASLAEARDQVSRANDVISRYVASQLAQQIIAGNYDVLERHDRRKLTLFFSDILDFSTIADHVEPEDLSEVLNEYLSEMASIGERYGGTIDKFVGDAVMIFFGAPVPTTDRDQAMRAVRMAIEMQERMVVLAEAWRSKGFDHPFVIRIGINTGRATIGSFGSARRVDYTAIGRQVNLAARLQSHCEPGRILLSHSTWLLVHDEVECIDKGEIVVKGFQDPVTVHEVVGLKTHAARAESFDAPAGRRTG
jgi:class 3 adenylate cyclase